MIGEKGGTDLDFVRRSKYLIVRTNPASGELEVLGFNTKFEVESYLNGCSNPADCIPAIRLDLECMYRLKCRKGR